MQTKVPVPNRKLIRRLRIEIVLLAISGGGVVALALWWTAAAATDPQPGAVQIILVAVFAAQAALAAFGAITGIGECRNEIGRAGR